MVGGAKRAREELLMQNSPRLRSKAALISLLLSTLLTLPLTAASIQQAKPEELGLSTQRLQRIHETIERHIEAGDIAGAVTVVARKGRVAHFEAQGVMDLESKKPMP